MTQQSQTIYTVETIEQSHENHYYRIPRSKYDLYLKWLADQKQKPIAEPEPEKVPEPVGVTQDFEPEATPPKGKTKYSVVQRKAKILEALNSLVEPGNAFHSVTVTQVKLWIECRFGWMQMTNSVGHLMKSLVESGYVAETTDANGRKYYRLSEKARKAYQNSPR